VICPGNFIRERNAKEKSSKGKQVTVCFECSVRGRVRERWRCTALLAPASILSRRIRDTGYRIQSADSAVHDAWPEVCLFSASNSVLFPQLNL